MAGELGRGARVWHVVGPRAGRVLDPANADGKVFVDWDAAPGMPSLVKAADLRPERPAPKRREASRLPAELVEAALAERGGEPCEEW